MANTSTEISPQPWSLREASQLQENSHCRHRPERRITRNGAVPKSRRKQSNNAAIRVKDEELVPCDFPPDDLTSFQQQLSVFSALQSISPMTGHTPRLVANNPDTRTILLAYPRLHWMPLHLRAKQANLNVSTLLDLKEKLRRYVSLLYSCGVAYKVKPGCIFLVKKSSHGWELYLGGWTDAKFSSERDRLRSTEWHEQNAAQLDEVECLFAPLEAHARSCGMQPENESSAVAATIAALSL